MAAYRSLTFPLKKDVSHSSVLVLLPKGTDHVFLSVVVVPRSAIPFTLQQQNLAYPPCSQSALL